MAWTTIRLELAATPAIPKGSVARSYVLRLPLLPDGRINERSYEERRTCATVQRHWPSESDRRGFVMRVAGGWALCCAGAQDGGVSMVLLSPPCIRLGEQVTLIDLQGKSLPFRVGMMTG